ncbi:unnamed protein product [Candidula unifasciata]|uniref:Tetratricopeptide repeat protein 29 n=1 Tax=Candidula unifasciata TaxID=100452 RepID=A0A8S3YV17_9EUPU|nr:unnamed protein product [Candidula unifasciata]
MALPTINKRKVSLTQSQRQMRPVIPLEPENPKGLREKLMYRKSVDIMNKLPILRKLDIDKFRNSYKHNLCLDMLTTGFHMSFCELVTLIRQQMERREAAGPESFLWTKPLLQDQRPKLDLLKYYTTKAESANREDNIEEEYTARYELAQSYTHDPDDQWLADHFFSTCLEVARRQDTAESRMLAEGLCNVGVCLQKNHHYREAAKHFESYHKLSLNHEDDWKLQNGVSFYTDSCVKLFAIYTIIGLELGRSVDDNDNEASLQMLIQALEMSKKSQDKKLEGEASYNLGLAYQKVNELDNALTHLYTFYKACQGDSDNEGTGQACDAIAKIYARQGNKEMSVEFLKRFVELTEKTGLEREYCLACYNLGNVCNSVGNYDEATEYFSKAYNISRVLEDPLSTNINRVQYGIAVAHRMMGKFANHVLIGDRLCVTRLLHWKSCKRAEFDQLIPDTDPRAALNILLPPLLTEKDKETDERKEERAEGDESASDDEQHHASAHFVT